MQRLPCVLFPLMSKPRDTKVRYTETTEASFRFSAVTGSTFIPYFAAASGRSTRVRTDRGRVIMRFHFYLYIDCFFGAGIFTFNRVRHKSPATKACYDSCIVIIGNQCTFRLRTVGFAYHAEQRFISCISVYHPVCIEYFMSAMFRISLCEHH